MPSNAAKKYFENYAVALSEDITDHVFDRVVVIPARREYENLIRTLRSIETSAHSTQLETLIIVVINGGPEEREFHLKVEEELRTLELRSPTFVQLKIIHLEKFGVGYARKVGMDFAARLYHSGKLRSPWLRTTDADAIVESSYLADNDLNDTHSAELYNFEHTYDSLDNQAAQAHCLYDIYLRYYRLGLEFARSPYAFFTVGSTLSVHADAYVQVRGFTDRDAGEDFYLLNKLAKVGAISNRKDSIQLEGRLSDRVPFGTGQGTRLILNKIREEKEHEFYDPEVFNLLKIWLKGLEDFAATRDENVFNRIESKVLTDFVATTNVIEELRRLPFQTESIKIRRRHMAAYFDAFRTLKLVHYIRDNFYPSIPWHEALRKAPFIDVSGPLDLNSVFEVGRQLRAPGV